MPSNPTIYDVSRLSGVSTATVSRAFSNPEHVKEYTRRKVYEAAEALHYSPNAIARAMARQRTDKIAYLICKKDATVLDEFYAGICEGIMQSANHSEFQLLVSTAEDWLHNVSTAQVILPATPSTANCCARWKRRTAASVFTPKMPSAAPQS